MVFPHYFHLFGFRLHPHPLMEVVAYSGGFRLFLLTRRHWPRAAVPVEQTLWILVGAIFGALVGSKALAWLESWPDYSTAIRSGEGWAAFVGGKTIVGGLLGGWAGVEVAKNFLGVNHSTGDAYVLPLIVGMSVGRIGCFLTGLADHTYGNLTSVPWAVDFGDGPRHPTQLYDIVALMLIGCVLAFRMRTVQSNGRLFREFVLTYCIYRFAIEFLKPTYRPYVGVSAIQVSCLIGATLCAISLLQTPISRAAP